MLYFIAYISSGAHLTEDKLHRFIPSSLVNKHGNSMPGTPVKALGTLIMEIFQLVKHIMLSQ